MRKHNYVVGYEGVNQCVYGKDDCREQCWVNPLTLKQAQKMAKELETIDGKKIYKGKVFKLVEVKQT